MYRLEISHPHFGHSVSFIGPKNEMYCNVLSDQMFFLSENPIDPTVFRNSWCKIYDVILSIDRVTGNSEAMPGLGGRDGGVQTAARGARGAEAARGGATAGVRRERQAVTGGERGTGTYHTQCGLVLGSVAVHGWGNFAWAVSWDLHWCYVYSTWFGLGAKLIFRIYAIYATFDFAEV